MNSSNLPTFQTPGIGNAPARTRKRHMAHAKGYLVGALAESNNTELGIWIINLTTLLTTRFNSKKGIRANW
jgi:hypothetical protein